MKIPYQSSEISIGNLKMGAKHAVVLQTMTSTDTNDTNASVEQIIRCFEAGAQMVRLTTQGITEAKNLSNIKLALQQKGINIPLVADVHFNPNVALEASAIVEKVRINPGNYTDKKAASPLDYTDAEYTEEIVRIRERLLPLIKKCKENASVIRIGVNHGSLSDRILSRFGDTPQGMVESMMEFLRICKSEEFSNVVVSMKASDTRVMIYSTRLLVRRMYDEAMHFPVHLGVTEAGDAEDGRVKSALGIGTLLLEGIGDTIRVSLTEDPEIEIPVAKKIANHCTRRLNEISLHPISYERRFSNAIENIGGANIPVVCLTAPMLDSPVLQPDLLMDDFKVIRLDDHKRWDLFDAKSYAPSHTNCFIEIHDQSEIPITTTIFNAILILNTTGKDIYEIRNWIPYLNKCPIILKRSYCENDLESLQVKAAADFGSLLVDGLGDGIWIDNDGNLTQQEILSVSFAILQAARLRLTRTDFISCPSCGRTLFNIKDALAKVKARTSHLKGLKIAVMGCIVNGPGEMADADYGYVGGAPGMISLYKGKECVQRNLTEDKAVDALIELIKINGDWRDE